MLSLSQFTAEKFRELVGEEASSKSGKFTFLNCFDLGSGTVACGVKEGVKLYIYNMRNAHVEKVRQQATEMALVEALKEGLGASEAAKQAQKTGAKAAKLASRQAKRILGPIISSGWDFFEAIYHGGSMTEGFLRGFGTLFGTYVGGFHGEQRLGKLGYLGGSHLGSICFVLSTFIVVLWGYQSDMVHVYSRINVMVVYSFILHTDSFTVCFN